LIRIMSLRLIQ